MQFPRTFETCLRSFYIKTTRIFQNRYDLTLICFDFFRTFVRPTGANVFAVKQCILASVFVPGLGWYSNGLTGFFWSAYLANLQTWRSIFIEGYEAMPGLVTQQGRFLRWATKATFIARKFDESIRASKDTSRLYTPQKGFVIFASLSSMSLQS